MAIVPDPTNRQPCCGAAGQHHFIDCPTEVERERKRQADATRVLHAVTVGNCQCNLCTADL